MKNKNSDIKSRRFKLFSFVGKMLCIGACATAGFVIAGPLAACLGVIAGIISGHLLEKGLQNFPI